MNSSLWLISSFNLLISSFKDHFFVLMITLYFVSISWYVENTLRPHLSLGLWGRNNETLSFLAEFLGIVKLTFYDCDNLLMTWSMNNGTKKNSSDLTGSDVLYSVVRFNVANNLPFLTENRKHIPSVLWNESNKITSILYMIKSFFLYSFYFYKYKIRLPRKQNRISAVIFQQRVVVSEILKIFRISIDNGKKIGFRWYLFTQQFHQLPIPQFSCFRVHAKESILLE